jgi:hypothetical protein
MRSAEPVSTQLWVEIRPARSPTNNQKLGHPALSHGSHTGREKFATGPGLAPTAAAMVSRIMRLGAARECRHERRCDALWIVRALGDQRLAVRAGVRDPLAVTVRQ